MGFPLPGVRVDPAGVSASVTIVDDTGVVATVFSDRLGQNPVSLPATITVPSTFYVPAAGTWTVNGTRIVLEANEVATVSLSSSAGQYQSTLQQSGAYASVLKHVAASRTAGSVAISSNTLVPVDSSGALDLVVHAAAGDYIEVGLNVQAGDNVAGSAIDFNILVLVGGVEVDRLGGSGTVGTIPAFTLRGGDYFGASGIIPYTVQPADISGGTVKLRLYTLVGSTARQIFATTAWPLLWWVNNYGQVGS
jgi:hypothetical protein